ncbi:uncharacterized protein LOC117648041 isoform X1 [Thrips palmi]|uniref:Uncharacterized protein LOC117648041 isoform X1 n=1 Tax=Thrips palmi TaxID=161013 RepID=A0A6P8ZC87_THRPL|nr:uncharacterized protein LOC117648041 isoform X1 [Thrips palmi]
MNATLTIALALLAAAACAQAAPSHESALTNTSTKGTCNGAFTLPPQPESLTKPAPSTLPPKLACYIEKSLVYVAELNYYCWAKAKLLIHQEPNLILTFADCVFTGINNPESTGLAPVFEC